MGAVAGLKPRKTTGISGSGKSSDHVEPRTLPRRRREVGATASSKPRTATGGSGSGSERGEPRNPPEARTPNGSHRGPQDKEVDGQQWQRQRAWGAKNAAQTNGARWVPPRVPGQGRRRQRQRHRARGAKNPKRGRGAKRKPPQAPSQGRRRAAAAAAASAGSQEAPPGGNAKRGPSRGPSKRRRRVAAASAAGVGRQEPHPRRGQEAVARAFSK